MSKLMTEVRGNNEIVVPKPKKRVKKAKVEGEEKPNYILIKEGNKDRVNELFKIYKESPFKARVKYFNDNRKVNFERLVIFEKGKNDFEITCFENNFGISVTNRMYSSQKKIRSIVYKGGKFWDVDRVKKTVRPLTWGSLLNFIGNCENVNTWMDDASKVLQEKSKVFAYLHKKFPWMLMLSEHEMSLGVNLNVVKEKKLFGYKDVTRHVMKVPNNIAEMVLKSSAFGHIRHDGRRPIKSWLETLKVLDGVQNLNKEMLNNHLFVDTCKMARTLGRKVNCRWGEKKLKDMHDKWAREIAHTILDCEDEYELAIRPEFKAFAEFSGFQLLRTNRQMLIEGMVQNHCVGTYIDRVNRGECAIFHIDGYTLQVGIKKETETLRGFFDDIDIADFDGDDEVVINREVDADGRLIEVARRQARMPQTKLIEVKKFINMQFRGRHNQSAPHELMEKVADAMEKFKQEGLFKDIPDNYKPMNTNSQAAYNLMNLNRNNDLLFDGDLFDIA